MERRVLLRGSGGGVGGDVTSELPRASSQRDRPASINTSLTLSLRGWRAGCGRSRDSGVLEGWWQVGATLFVNRPPQFRGNDREVAERW